MIGTAAATLAAAGLTSAGILGGSKLQSSAANKSAALQTRAATEAARIQAESIAEQLAYTKRQAELARLSERFASKQNQGLSRAAMDNDFARYGDTSFNNRASERSLGLTQDNIYGGRERQKNFMREMLGMPENPLSVYVEPDALRLTRPTMPDYVEDPTPIE